MGLMLETRGRLSVPRVRPKNARKIAFFDTSSMRL